MNIYFLFLNKGIVEKKRKKKWAASINWEVKDHHSNFPTAMLGLSGGGTH